MGRIVLLTETDSSVGLVGLAVAAAVVVAASAASAA